MFEWWLKDKEELDYTAKGMQNLRQTLILSTIFFVHTGMVVRL